MVEGIGGGSGALGREAIRAALDAQRRAAERVRSAAEPAQEAVGASGPDFAQELSQTLQDVNDRIVRTEALPEELLSGKIGDFHEVAVQLKQADLGFRFALEIRNKLIDAYREVMRMSV